MWTVVLIETWQVKNVVKVQIHFLSEHFGKIILACIAAGSFAIAFGSEKISQWFSPLSTNSTCLNQFYREVPPALNKESLKRQLSAVL